jgi:hypothetical protein
MTFDWTQGSLAEGLRRYEAGEFFAAHEAWESLWLESQEPEKTFLQGLIQVTAAFHHLQRNNSLGLPGYCRAPCVAWSPIRRASDAFPSSCCVTIFANYKHSIRTNRLSDWLRHEYDPTVYSPPYELIEDTAQRGMGAIATIG